MNDLLEQLGFAIDLAEQAALASVDKHWRLEGVSLGQVYAQREDNADRVIAWCGHGCQDDAANAIHIMLNDPARVLRRVARDRKLLERHKPERRRIQVEDDAGWTGFGWYVCTWCTPNTKVHVGQRDLIEWPCDDVRDMAEDYEIEVES